MMDWLHCTEFPAGFKPWQNWRFSQKNPLSPWNLKSRMGVPQLVPVFVTKIGWTTQIPSVRIFPAQGLYKPGFSIISWAPGLAAKVLAPRKTPDQPRIPSRWAVLHYLQAGLFIPKTPTVSMPQGGTWRSFKEESGVTLRRNLGMPQGGMWRSFNPCQLLPIPLGNGFFYYISGQVWISAGSLISYSESQLIHIWEQQHKRDLSICSVPKTKQALPGYFFGMAVSLLESFHKVYVTFSMAFPSHQSYKCRPKGTWEWPAGSRLLPIEFYKVTMRLELSLPPEGLGSRSWMMQSSWNVSFSTDPFYP